MSIRYADWMGFGRVAADVEALHADCAHLDPNDHSGCDHPIDGDFDYECAYLREQDFFGCDRARRGIK